MGEPSQETNRLSHDVIGAAIEVHRTLGPGFLESAYELALVAELASRAIPFARQVTVDLAYKGTAIGQVRLDLLVGGLLIVELKAVEAILPIHLAQLRSYVKAVGAELGLIINFNTLRLAEGVKRVLPAS